MKYASAENSFPRPLALIGTSNALLVLPANAVLHYFCSLQTLVGVCVFSLQGCSFVNNVTEECLTDVEIASCQLFQPYGRKYVCVSECSGDFVASGLSKYCVCNNAETPYLFQGTCVDACPRGHVTTGDRTCAPCPGVILHNQCFDDCPEGLFADLDAHKCVSVCPSYRLSSVCVDKCPPGFAVYNSEICVASCPENLLKIDGKCQKCANYVWNAQCVESCPPGARRNAENSSCYFPDTARR